MKVNVGRFLAPTQTLKTMSAFRDGVSRYVLVYNIFIYPGVNGFFLVVYSFKKRCFCFLNTPM